MVYHCRMQTAWKYEKGVDTMKKQWKIIGALGLSLSLLMSSTALAAHPKGYWPYLSAFNNAKTANNQAQMITTGNKLLQYYQNLPLDSDVASIRYNVNYANYPIYEKQGNYTKAKEALQQVATNGAYLGFNDAVTMANERMRKISPNAQVYALTNTSAPYYGAKHEPKNGTLYGRVWTEQNDSAAQNEAIVSFYIEMGQNAADYERFIEPYEGGDHVIHIAWNFPGEGSTVSAINSGSYDSNIQQTLQYLATIDAPVLLRIGGEMNIWTTATTGDAFKAAYTRIAKQARTICPNVALVFSTNYTSPFGGSMEPYFPDASLVDWVGTSLYNNKYQSASNPTKGVDNNEMYFGIGDYADPVKNLSHTADLAKKYNKPIIITEGGSGYLSGNADTTTFAADRIREAYTSLNMVYPQVKAIIHFDRSGSGYDYSLQNNATVQAAYNSALKSNPTLMSSPNQTVTQSFKPLSQVTGANGVVTLRAYCDVIGQTVTVTYSVDGKWVGTQKTVPYNCQLDTSTLTAGNHTLKVVCNAPNGYSQTLNYQLTKAANGSVSFKQA